MKKKKQDRISVFSQLTSSGLADSTLFTDVLDNHYEKFQYVYNILGNIDPGCIKSVNCERQESSIVVYIKPSKNNNINDIIYTINNHKRDHSLWAYFNIDLIEVNKMLKIIISMCDDREEGDIYVNTLI